MSEVCEQQEVVSQVEKALYQLYQDPNPDNRREAEKWLISLQQSPLAWTMCWQLMQQESVEVQNFGALLLHNKISKSWNELPKEQYETLRVELIKAVAQFSGGAKVVLTRLCVALVCLAFHCIPDQWPNALVSMIQSVQSAAASLPNSNAMAAVLQLLTVIPEEFDSTSTTHIASRRAVLNKEIRFSLGSVLALLEEVLGSTQPNVVKITAMKCCSSWVQFGLPLPQISNLLDFLLRSLVDPELLPYACDVLTDLVAHQDSFKYPDTLKKILFRLIQLSDFIQSQIEDHNLDESIALCKLVQETLESNMDLLVSEDTEVCEEAMDGVLLLLRFFTVAGCYPVDEKCSVITLSFWEHLLDRIASTELEQSKVLQDVYVSVTTSIVEVFPEKAQYPSDDDWEAVWSEDEKDDFIKYRDDLSDLGDSIQRMMHFEYLQHLCSRLQMHFSGSSSPPWQPVEAVLFLLQGVATNLTQQSSSLVHGVVSLLPRMPPHPTLIKTVLRLLGCLSMWFRSHTDLLRAVLPMILEGLTRPHLAPSAALAFRDVCGECAEQLTPFVLQLVLACQRSLADPNLENRDCVRLVASIGNVLCFLPFKDVAVSLEPMAAPCVQKLQELSLKEPWTQASKPAVERELMILGAFCHYIYLNVTDGEQHPVLTLLVKVWPSLRTLVSKWCSDQDIVDIICVCWSRAMRTICEQYVPLLEGTVEMVVKCYAAVHYPRLLDSATQIVETFGKEGSCSALIINLLQQLHTHSLSFFQSSLSDSQDVLQSYLVMMSRCLQLCPVILLSIEKTAKNLFDIASVSLGLSEQRTVQEATSFFATYISLINSFDPVREVLGANGLSLVKLVCEAVAGGSPRSYLDYFCGILSAMNTHCISLLSVWLEELLSQEGFPSPHLSVMEKQSFKSTVLRERANPREMKEKVKEFSLMCRGFHGTLYAAETL